MNRDSMNRMNEINSLHRMLELTPSQEPEGDDMDFKFKIGQKVFNKAFGYNAIVTSRSYSEYGDGSSGNSYYLAIWQSSPPTSGSDILEGFIEDGHRIE